MNKVVLPQIKNFCYNNYFFDLDFQHRIYLSGDDKAGKT